MSGRVKAELWIDEGDDNGDEVDYQDSQRADQDDTQSSGRHSLDATVERLERLVSKHRAFFPKEYFDAF